MASANYFCMSFKKLYLLLGILGWLFAACADTFELTPAEKTALTATAQGGVVVLSNLWTA